MQTVKQEVSDLLNRLPEDCSLEDIQYHLYVLQKIERGLKDAEQGRVYLFSKVGHRKEDEKWHTKKEWVVPETAGIPTDRDWE